MRYGPIDKDRAYHMIKLAEAASKRTPEGELCWCHLVCVTKETSTNGMHSANCRVVQDTIKEWYGED